VQTNYTLVRLRNGTFSVRSLADDETFHPGIGPVAEAEALYVRQLGLPERVRETAGDFVLWDVGLGSAANALTALTLIGQGLNKPKTVRVISFDQTSDALAFALKHRTELGYIAEYETALAELVKNRFVRIQTGLLKMEWTLELGDFPAFLAERRPPARPGLNHSQRAGPEAGAPHAILFDPHSPKKNPAMWTAPLFANLFGAIHPEHPCALATFTRSTMARTAMLLGGFFVGVGHPSGFKEETTVAANRLELLEEPLDQRWLERAKRSDAGEPLREPIYRRVKLSSETWEKLRAHPQFR